MKANQIRNVAIIAHVDHGKTTLIDSLFQHAGTFRTNQKAVDRVMDNMDLERERGITISAKNCSIDWQGVKINIIDTPGHADFGGEVERALSMVEGAILLVDAAEGPLPQTRFVLLKALSLQLKIVLVINKIDRTDARPHEVLDEVLTLLIDLGADEEQLDLPVLYAAGRSGIAKLSVEDQDQDLGLLLDILIDKIPKPKTDLQTVFRMLVSDLGYADHLGRLAIGKIHSGKVSANENLICIGKNNLSTLRVTKLQLYKGLNLAVTTSATAGDIVILSGVNSIEIGDTICSSAELGPIERIEVDSPTVSMSFTKNTSPLAGNEGVFYQSSKIKERLQRETLQNVAIQIEEYKNDIILVKGRGEFQLAILIETMRREGFEFCVGRPQVIFRNKNGKTLEPFEELIIDCTENYTGIISEKLSRRKAKLIEMSYPSTGRIQLRFHLPTRGLIGFRDQFLTDTRGTGVMNTFFIGYEPYQGDFQHRATGSLVSDRSGHAVAYAISNLEPRGRLFVRPGDPVYEGMLIGEHNRENDLIVNPCKSKKLSNVRAAGKDDTVILTPVSHPTIEDSLQFIRDDELLEVTPLSLRMRKQIFKNKSGRLGNKK